MEILIVREPALSVGLVSCICRETANTSLHGPICMWIIGFTLDKQWQGCIWCKIMRRWDEEAGSSLLNCVSSRKEVRMHILSPFPSAKNISHRDSREGPSKTHPTPTNFHLRSAPQLVISLTFHSILPLCFVFCNCCCDYPWGINPMWALGWNPHMGLFT